MSFALSVVEGLSFAITTMIDLFAWQLSISTFTGTVLWSLALYIGLDAFKKSIIDGLERWFNFAERFLYTSQKEFERTRAARESQNAFFASLMSIIPFLLMGILCNWLVEIGFDKSWSISVGILIVISCAVYNLGRIDFEE